MEINKPLIASAGRSNYGEAVVFTVWVFLSLNTDGVALFFFGRIRLAVFQLRTIYPSILPVTVLIQYMYSDTC